MKQITKKIFSHRSIQSKEKYYVRIIRKSKAKPVRTFRSLVEFVSQITYENPEYSIFFRGQENDYLNNENQSSAFPSLYRDKSKKMTLKIRREGGKLVLKQAYKLRMEKLEKVERLLINKFFEYNLEGLQKIKKFKELSWAILQHYEVCPTPLLDLTHSLRVAATFGLRSKKNEGYLYLFGFPHINGSISYYVEEELMNIKLLSACPPKALRPYYQEGFLAGSFPVPFAISNQYDFGRRLIAKFKLIKKDFWDDNFTPIPEIALFPDKDDIMKNVCDEIKILLK